MSAETGRTAEVGERYVMHVGENIFPRRDRVPFKNFRKVAETGDSAHIKYSFHERIPGGCLRSDTGIVYAAQTKL